MDGYRRVRSAKEGGRLRNIELILPVVEFRLKQLVGHKKLQRINYHIVFSDELRADEIQSRLLNKLSITYKLQDDKEHTVAGCDRDSLIDLGKAIIDSTPESKRANTSPLMVGFANAVFSLEDIEKLCEQTIFDKRIVTALGITEWDDMRFDGGATGVKRSLINGVNLVFVASPNIESYRIRREQLVAAEVNDRLLDGSDSHNFADSKESMRLGNVLSWLKADLTFEGLRRAISCFEDRAYVTEMGATPEKLAVVQSQKGKFIDKVVIRKKEGSGLDEVWFDCEVPLNTDLVAIIGNQGGGKSALTDVIALCGNTKTTDFSFLCTDKFRDRDHKASHFEATIYWADETSKSRVLDEEVLKTESERVRYVPQRFFEVITNETDVRQNGNFYRELKKVIFSHIDKSDRLKCSDLDALVALRTEEINNGLTALRQDLRDKNEQIVTLEHMCSEDSIEELKNKIRSLEQEIATHNAAKPVVNDPSGSDEINQEIALLRQQESELDEVLAKLRSDNADLKQRKLIVEQKRQGVENERDRIQKFIDDLQSAFEVNGISLKATSIISINVNLDPFNEEEGKILTALGKIKGEINQEVLDSPAYKKLALTTQREKLQTDLDESSKTYQLALNNVSVWEKRLSSLIGDIDIPDSLRWLQNQLQLATTEWPEKLALLYDQRLAITKKIHSRLWESASVYEALTQAVRNYIDADELTRERYQLKFTIQLSELGFTNRMFDMIKYRSSFAGQEEGRGQMNNLIQERNFSLVDDTVAFIEDVMSRLRCNYHRTPPAPEDISKMMRTNYHLTDLYDYVYGLEYLNPQYSMTLNGKALRKLSPGERGVLLLVFYLVVDQGNEPLIIDQPEGNLNNQAIYNHLVPVFKEAKKRRQLIIVTHNPNLAVVSDAEQIIHARIDPGDGNRVHFQCGAIENPIFKSLTVDVLEGTAPAFKARHNTYNEIL